MEIAHYFGMRLLPVKIVIGLAFLAAGFAVGRQGRLSENGEVVAKEPASPSKAKTSSGAETSADRPEATPKLDGSTGAEADDTGATAAATARLRSVLQDSKSPPQDRLNTARELARHDLERAVSMLLQFAPPDRDELIRALVTGAMNRDKVAQDLVLKFGQAHPEALAHVAALVGSDLERRKLTSILAAQAAEAGLEAGMAYANALPDPRSRMAARRTIFKRWSEKDPAALAAWVDASTSLLSAQDLQIAGLELVTWNPQRAAEIVLEIPDQAIRFRTLSSALSFWSRKNPEAASMWVSRLPPSLDRDKAVSGMALGAVSEDPWNALQWAGTIADADILRTSLSAVLNGAIQRSPELAREWLQQNQARFPPSIMKSLEMTIANPGHTTLTLNRDGRFYAIDF